MDHLKSSIKYFESIYTIDEIDWYSIETINGINEQFAIEMACFLNGYRLLTNNTMLSASSQKYISDIARFKIDAVYLIIGN